MLDSGNSGSNPHHLLKCLEEKKTHYLKQNGRKGTLEKYILLSENVRHIKIGSLNRYIKRIDEFISDFGNDPLASYGKESHFAFYIFLQGKKRKRKGFCKLQDPTMLSHPSPV